MSSRRDVNAPQKLSVDAYAQLLAEDELVAMRNARKEVELNPFYSLNNH